MIIALVLFLIFVIFVITPLVAASMLARRQVRMVWPYSPLEPQPHFDSPSGYAVQRTDAAVRAGCALLGWVRDLNDQYQISYAMLVPPERDCFIFIGAESRKPLSKAP